MIKLRKLFHKESILCQLSKAQGVNRPYAISKLYFSTRDAQNLRFGTNSNLLNLNGSQRHMSSSVGAQKKERKSTAPEQYTQDYPDNFIIKIPLNTNTFRLSRLFNVEPGIILRRIQNLSKEIYTDEFQILSRDAIELAALEFDKEVEFVEDPDIIKNMKVRPPIVTIMGHVDHGKTTLLDSFRHSLRVKEEYGSITQSIGAFTITTDSQHVITFIDTPGHEAFENMRMRGAQVTDLIILVVSAIESVQPQTIEVIEIARGLKIPVIVAINKIDRPAADVEAVLLDLSSHNLIPEDLGGDVICVPISAKMGTNLDLLEKKIIEVSETKLDLKEDFTMPAQCYVIESNFDDKTTQITATVIVKQGTLRVDDIFVCGVHEGKARFMLNDQGKNVKEATPGQAVKLGGFKTYPDVGTPLYQVSSHDEAKFIVETVKTRKERESLVNKVDPSKKVHDLQKNVGKYSRIERAKLAGGDKIIFYEKLGLVDQSDIEVYRKKLGIPKNVDLDNYDIDGHSRDQTFNAKKSKGTFKAAKKEHDKEELKKLIKQYKEEQDKIQKMDEEEALKYNMEKTMLREAFRNEEIKHFPIMIKASTTGALETLIKETERVIYGQYRISIIEASVGPLSEADITAAAQTGATIFGFDIPVTPNVARMAEPQKVPVRLHKIIYKFLEEIDNFVYDVKNEIALEEGKAINVEVLGAATISQLFQLKSKGKPQFAAGCKVHTGEVAKKYKFRILRDELVIGDNLKLANLKRINQDVGTVEKGLECGMTFENFDGELQVGDVVECYRVNETVEKKFNSKPGIHQVY